MRRRWLFVAAVVGGCATAEKKPEVPPPPSFSLADVAGTWNVKAMRDTGDVVLVEYQMTGTANPATWTMTLPNRGPIGIKVSVDGDSLMTDTGPFESVLRKGVVVATTGVVRLREGQLVGKFVAKYATRMVDSVLTGRTVATRQP